MSDIIPDPPGLTPRWVVVMESGMQRHTDDGGAECDYYTMGIALDDSCVVVLRESGDGWQDAGGWLPLAVVRRLAELLAAGELEGER